MLWCERSLLRWRGLASPVPSSRQSQPPPVMLPRPRKCVAKYAVCFRNANSTTATTATTTRLQQNRYISKHDHCRSFCETACWNENGDVIRHALQGGRFYKNVHAEERSSSLTRFQALYANDSDYHDLFVIAKGRNAVRYSCEVIGRFWTMEILSIGPPVLVTGGGNVEQRSDNGISTDEIILRVPYILLQSPRFLPLPSWFSVQYHGWINLHLKEEKTQENAYETTSKDPSSSPTVWVISIHDDRMASRKDNALSSILAVPLVGPIFQSLRKMHGSVIQFLAHRRYKER